ncbi:MAG: hypothetical protein OJF47_000964 [Nitrospira sp.]|jgi:uncharacterized protein (TIGR02270 family)|nr:MAG: hypothetical protein OJF47_000964 [Nitrospira sp.]
MPIGAGPRRFYVELYKEHLDEASFLYGQRLSLLDNPEMTWKDLAEFEERFEAHIDALVVGKDLALEMCRDAAVEGDYGELHAAVRVFCRQRQLDSLFGLLEGLKPTDEQKVRAMRDALKHELPEEWTDEFLSRLSSGDPRLAIVFPEVFGYRRVQRACQVLERLAGSEVPDPATVLWALGRLGASSSALPSLKECLTRSESDVQKAAALALARLGNKDIVAHCAQVVPQNSWAALILGLAADRSAVNLLLERVRNRTADRNVLLGLGLLGDMAAVEVLQSYLSNADLGESAALALNLITGAQLYEQVFIPELVDEDELFDEERGTLKQGEPFMRPDGRPYGSTVTRLSLKLEAWQRWWSANKLRFDPNLRYRNGKPYSPARLLENLVSEQSPRQVRQLAYEEFVIRYAVDFPFETDMSVAQQEVALTQYAEWVKVNGDHFQEGSWYFAGQLQRG